MSSDISLATVQAGGFPMGGENLAVDLADTLVTTTEPATDLLASDEAAERFWELHRSWLPSEWAAPARARLSPLRATIRRALDALVAGLPVPPDALSVLNETSSLVCVTSEVVRDGETYRETERYRYDDPSDLALAAVARSAIAFLGSELQRRSLRRCANPGCSMLFFKGDSRRRFCTPNICANRERVARHYKRHRKA